jgi:DNA-binding XRE family transcriptional regulator
MTLMTFAPRRSAVLKWDSLPVARRLNVTPLSAFAREHGQSVQLVDADGREVDVDAGSLRPIVGSEHLRLLESADGDLRLQMGARLRRVREESGLSQQLVSERGGMAQESLSRIENGRRDPRFETLRKPTKGMDMALPELLKSLSYFPDQASGVTG